MTRQTALSRVKGQLYAAEEFIKDQRRVHEEELMRRQAELDTVNRTLQNTKEIYQTKCAELRTEQNKYLMEHTKNEQLLEEVNNSRGHIYAMEVKLARIEGYLTRVNEPPAKPPMDELRLVEVPRWWAMEALGNGPQRSKVNNWHSAMGTALREEEPDWFKL
jgi:hypothetical protein